MAEFPGAIKTFREVADLPGVVYEEAQQTTVFAKDTTDAYEEIVAIEQTLGTGVNGDFSTVADRLANMVDDWSHVRLKDGTGFDLPNETAVPLIFDDLMEDINAEYDPITGIFTAQRRGRYAVNLTCSLDADLAAGSLQIIINVNGSAFRTFETKQLLGYDTWQVSDNLALEAGDEIMLAAYQDSGSFIEMGYYAEYNVLVIEEL